MNKEYIQTGDNFIISTDKGLKKVNRINNLKEILETENNIEEIENLKKKNDEEDLFDYKEIISFNEKTFLKKLLKISLPIIAVITIIISIINNIYMALVTLPLLVCGDTILMLLALPLHAHKTDKNIKNMSKSANEVLEKELKKEKENLKTLTLESKELAKNDLGIMSETVKINRTKLIKELNRKLKLIQDYQLMKKDLIEYSKDHFASIKLRNMGYSESDVNFIFSLMEQDIKEREREKEKTLKLEKK